MSEGQVTSSKLPPYTSLSTRRDFQLDLRSLVYFARIADAGAITRAAEQLGVAQPALTRTIKQLETEMKVRLFVRLPRGIRLTAAGREFLEFARRMISDTQQVRERLREVTERPSGKVVFGTSATVATFLVPELVERVQNLLPEVNLKIVEANSPQLRDALLSGGKIDFAVLTNPPPSRRLSYTPLLSEPLVLLCSPQAQQPGGDFSVKDLSRTPLIITAGIHRLLADQIVRHGAKVKVDCEVDAIEAIRELIRRNAGMSVMPISTFHDDILSGRLIAYPISGVNLHRMLILAHAADGELAAAVRETISVAQDAIRMLQDKLIFSIPKSKPVLASEKARTRAARRAN